MSKELNNRENFINKDLESCTYKYSSRYLLEISFDGSNYGGWQIQPNQKSIQETIQLVLSRLYNYQKIELVGSSRTDAGVHAINFAAAFLVPESPAIPIEKLKNALNMMLPDDIKIRSVREVDINFHARFHTYGKAYTYVINLGGATPFTNRYSFSPKYKLDIEQMEKAAKILEGRHDFSSFVCSRNNIDDAVRTIYSIKLQKMGEYLTISYIGDGFLYKMIRCLTGALLAVGAKKCKVAEIKELLRARDRSLGHTTAKAGGLFLVKVFYKKGDMEEFKLESLPFYY